MIARKRNAAPGCGRPQDGDHGEQLAFPGFADTPKPRDDSTIPTAKKQPKPEIAWLIGVGAQNATTLSQLAKLTGMNRRDVRRAIQRDRTAGFPICADCKNGYFMPSSAEEKRRCVSSMRRRAKEVYKTAIAIERGRVRDAEEESG